MTGESPVVGPGSSDGSRTNDPRGSSKSFNTGSGVGNNQAYMGEVVSAGTPVAFSTAMGVGVEPTRRGSTPLRLGIRKWNRRTAEVQEKIGLQDCGDARRCSASQRYWACT